MIVPRFWAEARVRSRDSKGQVTVRRFGWSDVGQAEAQANAETRAHDAMRRIQAGEKLSRQDRKVPYNGADGVPIREEIVAEHGSSIITRNAYGARCLNTPDVLFVDVDFESQLTTRAVEVVAAFAVSFAIALAIAWALGSPAAGFFLAIGSLLSAYSLARFVRRRIVELRGGPEQISLDRIRRYSAAHPEAHLRLYRTPAGLRVLAMHRTFDPRGAEVSECFAVLGADPIYARMCLHQNCFRARVSPKPWRIGIGRHIRPRPGTWPVKAQYQAARAEWIEAYERAAQGFASCRYVDSLGPRSDTAATRQVQTLHDDLCRATSELPIA